jgi:hypothetical protein
MISCVALTSLLTALAAAQAPAGAAPTPALARVLGDEAFAVVHVDLNRFDVPALARTVLGKFADDARVRSTVTAVSGSIDALKRAGAKELFVLFDPADIPGLPVVAVPLAEGADGRAIVAALLEAGLKTPLKVPASETIRDVVVAGSPAAVARIKSASPAARPDLAEALAAGRDATVKIALDLSATQRRALEESMADLPPELGGGSILIVSRGLRWASITLGLEPKPALGAVVQARDADAARELYTVLQHALDLADGGSQNDPTLAPIAPALRAMKPEVKGDRIELQVDPGRVAELLTGPISRAREAARFSQCVNHLKQIGLALHNYHSAHNAFPAAYSSDKDGQRLMSWRVLILPFLDAKALYDEFHLDEPWDSPHNAALIPRMPSLYACPSANEALAKEGKTTYLTLRGPATIFPGAEGVKIQDITDGATNTILVVDVSDDAAVAWTKPEDYAVTPEFKTQGLFGHHSGGTQFLFGDGAVRFLRGTLPPRTWKVLSTRNGREVISPTDF